MNDLKIQHDEISIDKFIVPFEQNHWFTGRTIFLKTVKQMLFDQTSKKYNHRIALYGMGGIGKTQTALEYVYTNRDSYERIYWITAVDQASLLSGYQKIATKAGLNSLLKLKPVEIAEGVLSWLRQRQSWLLVIDNLDDINVATGFLPENGPQKHTLITTRNPNSAGIPAEGLEVPLLDAMDSIDLLCTLSKVVNIANSPENIHAARIVEELGYLPLGIEQAAAYVREVAGDFATFLEHYYKIRPQLYKWVPKGSRQYSFSIATTWSMSFNVVRESDPQAAKLFQLLSFLNPDGILIDFLESAAQVLDNDSRKVVSNPIDQAKALIELEKFSLLKWNRLTKTLVIHRLVQAVIRDEMSVEERAIICNTVVDICDESFPREWNPDTRPLCRVYSSQVLVPLLSVKSIQTMKLIDIMERVGDFLRNDGKYNDSARLLEEGVQIGGAIRGADDPSTLTSMNNLASTYGQQGRTKEACELEEEVLRKRKEILGDDHPDTLTSMNNLASTYWQQGRTKEACELQEEVLQKMKEILGDDHPDTLMSMNNLALTYKQQGRTKETCELEEEVLRKRKEIQGDDHPDTLTSMNNLASTYWQQGRTKEACELQEEVLRKRKEILETITRTRSRA